MSSLEQLRWDPPGLSPGAGVWEKPMEVSMGPHSRLSPAHPTESHARPASCLPAPAG